MQPATWLRRATAMVSASTASFDFIRLLMEYPTIRFDHSSLIAHRYSLP